MTLFDPDSHKVVVMNREDFEEFVDGYRKIAGSIKDAAFIEIYTGPKGKPVLPKSLNMIALDFDDWPADIVPLKLHKSPTTITPKQAEKLVRFIRRHWGKNFIIHFRRLFS